MVDRDDRASGGRDADVAAPTGVGAAPGGLGAGGLAPGIGGLGGAIGADVDASDAGDDGTKGGRIGDDQNASAGAVGAEVGNQRRSGQS